MPRIQMLRDTKRDTFTQTKKSSYVDQRRLAAIVY